MKRVNSADRTPFNSMVVLGPTASGKTRLAVMLADRLGGEVVSADSRQVYRGLDIGSGKDLDEYTINGRRVPHHLVDVCELTAEFSVFAFQQACFAVLEDCWARGVTPIICGGTGLYLEAVLQGYRLVEAPVDADLRAQLAALDDAALCARLDELKPEQHNTTDMRDRDRTIRAIEIAEYSRRCPPPPAPDLRPLVLGVKWPRDELRMRIRARLESRLKRGLIGEVQGLLDRGVPRARLELLGLEYRFVSRYLAGHIRNRNDLLQQLDAAIVQFARRQDTWFRRMERRGTLVVWVPGERPEVALDMARAAFSPAG